MNEAARQQALLAMIDAGDAGDAGHAGPATPALRERGARALRGIETYRVNAQALADRALAAVFTTVRTMVGGDDFAQLAREFWRAHPPRRGDMGEWGDAFPAWLAAHAGLTAWPWLGDCAQLDLALHRSERAADAELDVASLALLESVDPVRLRLVPMPGTALLGSRWPIATIHRAHQLDGAAAEAAFAAVREAIDAQRGEHVLVVRRGWRAIAHPLDPDTARWTRHLLDGENLGHSLEAVGSGFDFSAWLATALRDTWLKGVIVTHD